MNIYFPIALVVLSNTAYHVCAKSAPEDVSPFAALSVSYAVGTVLCLALYYFTQTGPDLVAQYHSLNWSSFALGFAIVGLEVGYMLVYRVGWEIGIAQVVQGAFLAILLLFVGKVFYGEAITLTKAAGIAISLAGLYLLNR